MEETGTPEVQIEYPVLVLGDSNSPSPTPDDTEVIPVTQKTWASLVGWGAIGLGLATLLSSLAFVYFQLEKKDLSWLKAILKRK
jgi:hypothetical protein